MSENFLPKIQFSGPLGRDAETGTTRNGKSYVKFPIACTPETWKDGDERPPAWWLGCFAFDQDAVDYCQNLRKGDRVSVIGSLKRNRHNGKEYWNVNVKGAIQIAAGRDGMHDGGDRQRQQEEARRKREAELKRQQEQQQYNQDPGDEDDIPF